MSKWYAKCGSNCGRCPALKTETTADRQRCSDGWHKYLGVRLDLQRCHCDGCQTPDDQNPTLVIGKFGCKIRRCAVFNGAQTCAHCSAYPCDAIQSQFSFDAGSRERFAERFGAPIPEDEYLAFVEPYELHTHLEEIRASLRPDEMVEVKTVSVKPRTVALPDDLPFSQDEREALKLIHGALTTAGTAENILHVQQDSLQVKRRHLLKILWTFGLHGKLQDGQQLAIDSETYLEQKIQSMLSVLEEYLEILADHGARCELVPSQKEGWLTPGGALRKGGWSLHLAFPKDSIGPLGLNMLQSYATALDEKHGAQAFRYFARADMRVLREQPTA